MKKGLILAGEPMGLLIAQSEGTLGSVTGYDLAVAGAEFNVAVGVARLGHRVTYLTTRSVRRAHHSRTERKQDRK